MAKEEYLYRLSLLQQEAEKIEEQIKLINQQINEFENLELSLEKIDEADNKEILAGLGKGIFVKSEIKEKKLFVNIGSDIVVRKNSEEAREIIDRQIKQMSELKINLLSEMENINCQLQILVEEARKED